MPKELIDKLKKEAAKKGFVGRRANAYVYGNPVVQEFMKKEKRKK